MPRHGGVRVTRRHRQSGGLRTSTAMRTGMLVGSVGTALTVVLALVPTSASADVISDQNQITQLEQRIAHDGQVVESLVTAFNQAQAQAIVATQRVQAAQARVASDQQLENQEMAVLRSLALNKYMSNASTDAAFSVFSTGDPTSAAAQEEYTRLANAGLHDTVDAVQADVRRTQADAVQLRAAQAQAQATVSQLAAARLAAQNALNQDTALLGQVKTNLAQLLAAAAAARRAAQLAQEQALAAQQAAAHPVSITIDPSPGTYANPLRGIKGLRAERIDQGVDYSGYGPIAAVGDGRVISTTSSGWPGGTFIAYKLTDGPASGLVVYAAEDISPLVQPGQTVTANTVIGTVYEGPNGIELGWADPSGDGVTMARDYGQFHGSNSTAFGNNFSQMLASLGAPPGVLQNNPPTGSLPPGWPQW
jgi:murein DD-endopeptidase MepM/ murein hydrolase activator NlpD